MDYNTGHSLVLTLVTSLDGRCVRKVGERSLAGTLRGARVLSEKLIVPQLVQKHPKVHHRIHRSPLPLPVPSDISPVDAFLPNDLF